MGLRKKIAACWRGRPSGNSISGSGTTDALYNEVSDWDLTKKGKFQQTSCIFSGFYSDVYYGTMRLHGDQRVEVAIKVLRFYGSSSDVLSPRCYKRLYSEILIWSRLNHPNIAQVYGFTKPDQSDRKPTIVSPWYKNRNIVRWLKNNTSANRMLILRDTISAVAYLHSQHIIHGDIKGDNVLVDDLENPRLCDFGLAHFVNEYPLDLEIAALLSSASLGRTLSFSSPELLDTGRSTEMSDVWALGCLGIQVLTNQMPYGWLNNATHIHQNIMLGHPPFDIGAFSPRNDIEHQLLGIISTCWAKNSNNRPSAAQLLSRVNSLIENGLQITTRLPMRESR